MGVSLVHCSHYDILFEPVRIGPVVAKNRFYQVPHCTGSGWKHPRILAGLRETKAEGGWAVVNTEYCSIHPSSDDAPYNCASLWDDGDIRAHALMTEKLHMYGALAGVELCIGGARMPNLHTREIMLGVVSMPNTDGNPFHCKAMDKEDIRQTRKWHRNAAIRAKKAGFDIVYVYATHDYLLSQFMSPKLNSRVDEYGGSLKNRIRLVRELLEETKEAVGDKLGVAIRFSAETNGGDGGDGTPILGETEEIFDILGEIPDLWDINVQDYSLEMGVSRFVKEGALENYVSCVKQLTSKPVVSVGRFTSPDTMVKQVNAGVLDFIGAARPSIADPFLPKKIEEGRLEDIRECIGCNICYMGDGTGTPIRCTQNPTMSEEWRRGWHPEIIKSRKYDSQVLIVGAGPAGLEAAHQLGKRGYSVTLAEATRNLGGRVTKEAKLPGLSEWIRVRDYRVQQLQKLDNVEIFLESELSAKDVIDFGADHIAVATGCYWRKDGFGINNLGGISNLCPANKIYSPDDIMAGSFPEVSTIIFDDDHYYMGTVMAEIMRMRKIPVKLITPADVISEWGEYTYDRWRAQKTLMAMGVELETGHNLSCFDGSKATIRCGYSGREKIIDAEALIMLTARIPNDNLYSNILEALRSNIDYRPISLKRIGDCEAPAIIAAAVYSGHKYARELEEKINLDNPLRYDRVFAEES